MNPWLMALGMGALGLLKSKSIDEPAANRQRDLAAKTQELSPWTGLRAQPVKEADPYGDALQFGATGLMMGDKLETSELDKELKRKAAANKLLNARVNIDAGGGSAPNPWGISLSPQNLSTKYNNDIWG